jgi:hypothetical protein
MGRKQVYSDDAAPEEKGSFCDRDSQHHYDNVDSFTRESQLRNAEDNGNTVTDYSEDESTVDSRYNLFYAEDDNHGFFHNPAQHRAGDS